MVTNAVIPKISLKGNVTRCFSLPEADRLSLSLLASVESLETMHGNTVWFSKYGLIFFLLYLILRNVNDWNRLHREVVSSPSLVVFKIHLYKSPE